MCLEACTARHAIRHALVNTSRGLVTIARPREQCSWENIAWTRRWEHSTDHLAEWANLSVLRPHRTGAALCCRFGICLKPAIDRSGQRLHGARYQKLSLVENLIQHIPSSFTANHAPRVGPQRVAEYLAQPIFDYSMQFEMIAECLKECLKECSMG